MKCSVPDCGSSNSFHRSSPRMLGDGAFYTNYVKEENGNDSGFFALMGCPNGSGIVRMLTDHCDTLGQKTIENVRVLENGLLTMYFVLADFVRPTRTPKRSAAGLARAAKRHQKSHPGEAQSFPTPSNACIKGCAVTSCMRFLISPSCLE